MQGADFGQGRDQEVDALAIDQALDAYDGDCANVIVRRQSSRRVPGKGVSWGTRWRKQTDSRISGTGGTGSVGRNWLTTTAFGMTCTIEGFRAPRRTVFSLL